MGVRSLGVDCAPSVTATTQLPIESSVLEISGINIDALLGLTRIQRKGDKFEVVFASIAMLEAALTTPKGVKGGNLKTAPLPSRPQALRRIEDRSECE